MKIFETERLVVRSIEKTDELFFTELLSSLEILEKIPFKPLPSRQIQERFKAALELKQEDLGNKKCICGIVEKGNIEIIGFALFLINPSLEQELGYRFRPKYWENGYGTETAKGMLDYYFNVLKVSKVMADVNIINHGSVKILEKFMIPIDQFFNEQLDCIDRRYQITKEKWAQRK